MASKTLSTGTLSLRFMQNAKKAPQVQLEQAEVKDDNAWEVPKHVRDAWDEKFKTQTTQSIAHESSYMPFIHDDPDLRVKGRREFKKGREVSAADPIIEEPVASSSSQKIDSDNDTSPKPKTARAPVKKLKKTALEAMREAPGATGSLRAELRSSSPTNDLDVTHAGTFVKPAGVVEPSSSAPKPSARDVLLKRAKDESTATKNKRARTASAATDITTTTPIKPTEQSEPQLTQTRRKKKRKTSVA